MRTNIRRIWPTLAIALALVLLPSGAQSAPQNNDRHWVATWMAAPLAGSPTDVFHNQTSKEGEAKREAINHWIRTSGAFDAVIDFDAAVRDPKNPKRFLPACDSGDHLHPGDAGYKAMANAIDLKIFQ